MASVTDPPRKRLSQKQLREQLRAARRQQARKARVARRQLDQIPQQLPQQVRTIFEPLEPTFSRPTYRRFVVLALAAILTLGGHTIANLLRCLGALAPGHQSSSHRVFSRDHWSSWTLARRFAGRVLTRFVPDGPITLAGDDTVEEHRGPNVYGKGCHRDPVRSTPSFTAYRWGHKWVVLTVLVPLPFTTHRWALPLLIALDQPEEQNRRQKRRHKTPSQLMRQMLRVLLRWFPDRTFVCTGDGTSATHELAALATQYPRRLTFVNRFSPEAHLVTPPPPYAGQGRPRVKGDRLPRPAEVVQGTAARQLLEVAWYGGGRRRVEVVTGRGCWYQGGQGWVPVLYAVVAAPETVDPEGQWQDLRAVGMAISERVDSRGRQRIETRSDILSRHLSAQEFANAVRGHWSLANTLHWQLDVSFREDECRVYRDHAPANLSVIRRFALGLLKRDKSCRRGIETKRLKCAANDEYREKVLFNTLDSVVPKSTPPIGHSTSPGQSNRSV